MLDREVFGDMGRGKDKGMELVRKRESGVREKKKHRGEETRDREKRN